MASTTYVDKVTVINTPWLNEVNGVVWTLFNAATTPSAGRTALGLGTLATQNASAVAITGGTISGLSSPLPVLSGGTGTTVSTGTGSVVLSNSANIQDTTTFFNASDPTKIIRFGINSITSFPTATTAVLDPPGYNASIANVPVGCLMDYAGSTAPTGWLICDGSVISRTTYSSLFAAIGTTWGSGDGSTTFGIPDLKGRMTIGVGAANYSEISTTSSGNGFVVVSNTDRWLTGMAVTLSALSGFTTSATAGPTYYVVRISATNIRLATTLALAQNETPDVTLSGSGSCTINFLPTSRALATSGGQATKAMTITEMISHNHNASLSGAGGIGGNFLVDWAGSGAFSVGPRGGNVAMPMMPPYAVVTKIIRAL